MKVLKGLKYSKDHEWVRVEGEKAYIGITDFAQHSLGDIVFLDAPQRGKPVASGDTLCVAESVKAASDIYSPISGTVIDVNEELVNAPEKINEDAYGSWIAAVEMSNPAELEGLMDDEQYVKFTAEEA